MVSIERDCTKSCEKISRLVTLRHTFPPLIQPVFRAAPWRTVTLPLPRTPPQNEPRLEVLNDPRPLLLGAAWEIGRCRFTASHPVRTTPPYEYFTSDTAK